jgi:hypothetical protein
MNILNKSIVAAVLGLSVASVSHAGVIYLTGSTAARSTVYTALIAPGAVFQSAPTVTTWDGSSPSGSTYMAFVGTLVGGSGSTTIDCDWSGSEAGTKDVADAEQESFLNPTTLNGQNNGTAVPTDVVNEMVNMCMADNAQAFSRTPSPAVGSQTEVGVVTFEFVRNPGLWTGTNVTDAQVQAALGGFAPRALFDGNSAHTGDFVYVEGRNNQSGTRVNAFGDTGFGILTSPNQIEINNSGVMQDLSGNGSGVFDGDFGFSSGGTLAATMGANTTAQTDQINVNTPNTAGFSVIAYLGLSDAATAITAGGVAVSFNGIPFSAAAVEQGQYTFWGNEYCDLQASPTTEETTAYHNLTSETTGISSFGDGTIVIPLSSMDAKRSGPNSAPNHN